MALVTMGQSPPPNAHGATDESAAISVVGLCKAYGTVEALAGVDLEVAPGEVFALLGPNGAGKTTLVEILEGYRQRSAGKASVLGMDPGTAGRRWRARIGLVLQSTTLFEELTVDEVVTHFAGFFPRSLEPSRVIEMVGLSDKRQARCRTLSGGQKRRVELAIGIVGDPELIFLDEPTTGLDPEGRRQLWEVVRGFESLGKTVLLTTHYLEEAEALANRVAVLIRGRIVAVGHPAEIGGRDRALATVRFANESPLAGGTLPSLPGEVVWRDGFVEIHTAQPTVAVQRLAEWATSLGVAELPGLRVSRPSLEDVYLEMVQAAQLPEVQR